MKLFNHKFSLKAEADFLNKISLYLSANLSLSESLQIIADQADSKSKKETLELWRMDIEDGKTLAQALVNKRGLSVSRLSLYAIMLGEQSAQLPTSLKDASVQIKKQLSLKKKIMSAVAYPATILLGTIGLILGLLLFVFPKIIPLFDSLDVELPLSTKALIGFSHFLSEYWWACISMLVMIMTGVIVLARISTKFRIFLDWLVIRMPIIGKVIRSKAVFNSFDSLHVLLRGGEQLSHALSIVSTTANNQEYTDALSGSSEEVTHGRSLAFFLKDRKKLFPSYIHGIIFAGERTGNIENAVWDVANIAEEELEDRLKILTASLEPILMVTMSFVIGFIALSIILPIYGITSYFQGS